VLIDEEKANRSVEWMCWTLKVPHSTFYDWRARLLQLSATAARR